MLFGPSSNEGFAELEGMTVMAVMVDSVAGPVLSTDENAEIVMVVLEITMTEILEVELVDVDDNEDEDLELDEVLPSTGEIEPVDVEEELIRDVDEEESEVEGAWVKVLVVKLLTKVVLVTKIPLGNELDVAVVALARHEEGIEVEEQQGSSKLDLVVGSKTPA